MVYRISCVCLGNICRSPMAEAVLRQYVSTAGLSDDVELDSSGTSNWHVGQGMDARARQMLTENGYPATHVAQQATSQSLPKYDLILTMDKANHADVLALATDAGLPKDHVRLFRSFDPKAAPDAEVPDPYYGTAGGFDEVLQMIERAADGVVEFVSAELEPQS